MKGILSTFTAKGDFVEIENVKRKKNRGGRFFFFVLTILCVGLCALVSQFFANVITTGTIGISAGATSNSGYCLYALALGSYSTRTQAEDHALSVRKQNAGGYVFEKDGKFYVIASVYEKKNDAESVLKNLSDGTTQPEVVEIKFNKVSLNKMSSGSLKKDYLAMVAELKNVFLSLYDISVSYDTSVYSETKARIEADNVKSSLSSKLDKLSNGASASDGVYYVIIKNKLQNIIDEIGEVVEYNSTDNYPFGAKLKNTYITIIDDTLDLIDLLNEE